MALAPHILQCYSKLYTKVCIVHFPKKASKDLDNPVQLTLLLLTKMHLSQLSHTQLMKIIRGMSFANSLEKI